jgi:hypothetical protein
MAQIRRDGSGFRREKITRNVAAQIMLAAPSLTERAGQRRPYPSRPSPGTLHSERRPI